MSDHQDRTRQPYDRGGRLDHYPRSDVEHAARELLKQCDTVSFPSASLVLAMDNMRKVLGEEVTS